MKKEIHTTCPYCGVGCGVVAKVDNHGAVEIKGDPKHPANFGRLCSKGAALADTLDLDGRLLAPRVDGADTDWDTALTEVAGRFSRIIEAHGPDAVAFYVSGQLLTEDYYVANKLMKGFIGSANIDTNSRLCMASAVAGYKRAFGSDSVPGAYEDLERAQLVVLVGANLAWCHPVLFQRLTKAKQDNPDLRVVLIDPRATASGDIADLHLPIKPGTDVMLFNGLLSYLAEQGEQNLLFTQSFTQGLDETLTAARTDAPDIDDVAHVCGLSPVRVAEFYRRFARTERTVTLYSQGVNQSSRGTDKVNAIINCHLFTGRIGRAGMGPFSVTGQPNAMGGREVGGLANQLAAHMELDNPDHRELVQRFWGAPRLASKQGLKAVDLFNAVEAGRIKAVWIMATNPAVSMPDGDRVRRALEQCELVVVSDCIADTDTTRYAHILLPAAAWGEKDGTVTNSERRISRQRAFLPPAGEAKPDWWIVTEVAKRMGHAHHFNYETPAQVFREYAALTGFENLDHRDLNVSGLAGLDDAGYESLAPVQWPVTAKCPDGTARLFADGRFYTPEGTARFVSVRHQSPAHATNSDFPMVLNTGRIRDQWHTMTRTGKAARLCGHIAEPYAELHPDDAVRVGTADGALVRVFSRWGEVIVRVRVSAQQQMGTVFVPMHWNDQYSSRARIDAVVSPAVDAVSGEPEFKYTPVRVAPYRPRWYGFLLSRRRLPMEQASYWSCSKGASLWRYQMAGDDEPDDWAAAARALLCAKDKDVGWVEYFDRARGQYRGARLVGQQLESCIFIGRDYKLPPREWLEGLFGMEALSAEERASLLSGRPAQGQPDTGRTVCACFNVGVNTLIDAIRDGKLTTVEAIGKKLNAGTNCGSCIPELKTLLAENMPAKV